MTAAATTKSADDSPAEDVFAGTPYRVVSRLGAGEMSEVFLVLHDQLDRELVAKLLHQRLAHDEQLVERVRVEAQSLARLHSPHIVEVTDFRRTRDGRPFLVMEQLLGRTLKDELAARHTLPLPEALRFVHQALSALASAHALGIVHRDIKPENLFLCQDLEDETRATLKVLDFGIARIVPGVSSATPEPLAVPTETGTVLGTPRYLSPEGARGLRVDQRADLYSLALVFYEMVAGRGPFDHLATDILKAHADEHPAAPSELASDPVPAEVDAVILRGLRKNPGERYQSAEEFQREVERLWALVQNSQALETTAFSLEETRNRPRGPRIHQTAAIALAKQPDPELAATRELEQRSPSTAPLAPQRPRAGPALMVASIVVALITGIGVAFLIALVLARVTP